MTPSVRGSSWWAWAGIGLALVALPTGQQVLLALGALVLAGGFVARWWGHNALRDTTYRREFDARRVFPDETLSFRMVVDNHKLLPLPWIEVEDHLPEELPPQDAHVQPSHRPKQVTLRRSAALAWHQRAVWPATLRCDQRGYFRFGPARLRSADLFGMYEATQTAPHVDTVLVYPRIAPLPNLRWPAVRPFGERPGTNRIYEDPLRLAGVRDYQPGDPLRRIDWKATARRGALQSRLFEPSASLTLMIAVDAATMPHVWEGYDPDLLERAISAAAGLAARAEADRYAFGLLANASFPESGRTIAVPPSRAPGQLAVVLEALAVISPFVLASMEDVLATQGRALRQGATLAVVGADLRPELAAVLRELAEAGHPTLFVCTANDPPAAMPPKVALHHAGPALRELAAKEAWGR